MMILKTYKGNEKTVGKQQLSSQIIMSTLRKIDPQFPILREARREILEDLMDITNAREIIGRVCRGSIRVEERTTELPSPFAFNMIMQGYTDLLKIEDRVAFVQRLHERVLQEIGGGAKKKQEALEKPHVLYESLWERQREEERLRQEEIEAYLLKLLEVAVRKTKLQPEFRACLRDMIRGEDREYPQAFLDWLDGFLAGTIPRAWADDLVKFLQASRD